MKHLAALAGPALMLTLAACGGPQFVADGQELPTPDDPGVYVVRGQDLQRIDGNPDWERQTWSSRSDLDPGVGFIVYEPGLSSAPGPTKAVTLRHVAWLRSELAPSGKAAPALGAHWVAPRLPEFTEPLVATPHPKYPDIYHFRPDRPLEPGLYEVEVQSPGVTARARIGVEWSTADHRAWSSENCVDRLYEGIADYQPCDTPSLRAAAKEVRQPDLRTRPTIAPSALKISLSKPTRENGGLTIRGVITNVSAEPQDVPLLRASILDQNGNPADSWLLAAPKGRLAPGGKTSFVTWRPAAQGGAKLNVDFVRERTG